MARHRSIALFAALIAAQAPAAVEAPQTPAAPAGTASTRYCMRVGPLTGNLAETIECWTRDEWAEQGVDIDKEWAREGVRTIG